MCGTALDDGAGRWIALALRIISSSAIAILNRTSADLVASPFHELQVTVASCIVSSYSSLCGAILSDGQGQLLLFLCLS